MTKLEKMRSELVKAEITLANARKRKTLLTDKVRKEEQRELQNLMDTMGLSLEDVRDRLGRSLSPNNSDSMGGDLI